MGENSDSEKESKTGLRLEHKLSKNFVSCHSDGAILAGPFGGNEKLAIIFYQDAATVPYEALTPGAEEGTYKIDSGAKKAITFREDVARVSMSMKQALELRDAIDTRLAAFLDSVEGEDER
jgi:hypothetical protein